MPTKLRSASRVQFTNDALLSRSMDGDTINNDNEDAADDDINDLSQDKKDPSLHNDDTSSHHTTDPPQQRRSTSSSAADSAASSSSSNGRLAKSTRSYTFYVTSCVAMAVPILLFIIYESIALSSAVHDFSWIEKTKGVIEFVGNCNSKIMEERGNIGTYLTTGNSTDLAVLRDDVNGCRRQLLSMLVTLSRDDELIFHPLVLSFAEERHTLDDIRKRVDDRNTSGALERKQLTHMIAENNAMVLLINSEFTHVSIGLVQLHAMYTALNLLGLLRGIGETLMETSSPSETMELLSEFSPALDQFDFAQRHLSDLRVIGFQSTWQHPATRAMWSMMKKIERPNGLAELRVNASLWWPTTTAGMSQFQILETQLLERFSSNEIGATVRDELIKLFVGVTACILGAILLAVHQSNVRANMMRQIDNLNASKRAISAFVPKTFLAAMGYTSITQVEPGHCTETALTMLFADIRRFTTVAEGMGNTELFDWVQAYFERMTGVIDEGHGSINQFIGDALFAVFKKAADACKTSVKMQTMVEKLNIDNRVKLVGKSRVPVEIGVGIHQDCVALGILGDQHRHTCTLISASVNMASRLEGLTKQLRCRIIISDNVVSSLSTFEQDAILFRKLGGAFVKGSDAARVIYEVFSADDDDQQKYKQATKGTFEMLVEEVTSAAAMFEGPFRRLKESIAKTADAEEDRQLVRTTSFQSTNSNPRTSSPAGLVSTSTLLPSLVLPTNLLEPRSIFNEPAALDKTQQGHPDDEGATDHTADRFSFAVHVPSCVEGDHQATTTNAVLSASSGVVPEELREEEEEQQGTTCVGQQSCDDARRNREGKELRRGEQPLVDIVTTTSADRPFPPNTNSGGADAFSLHSFDSEKTENFSSYETAIQSFLFVASGVPAMQNIREYIKTLLAAQKFYEVTDRPMYCLLRYTEGNRGMVFGSK